LRVFYPDPHTIPESPEDIPADLLRVDDARSPCRSLAKDDMRLAASRVLGIDGTVDRAVHDSGIAESRTPAVPSVAGTAPAYAGTGLGDQIG
jgi:hypothetical protein